MWVKFLQKLTLCVLLACISSKPAEAKIFAYEPARVKVSGVLCKLTSPGAPNYESIKKGDEKEVLWMLRLRKPISVKGPSHDADKPTETGLTAIQLVLSQRQYSAYRKLINRRVIVRGQFFHSHTAHHRTRVLLFVTSIK